MNEMMSEISFLEFPEDASFEFRKDGKVIITDEDGEVERFYFITDNVLTIEMPEQRLEGSYSVSANHLIWTISEDIPPGMFDAIEDMLEDEDLGPFKDLIIAGIRGITGVTMQLTFARQ
jgi:hypothetical protein